METELLEPQPASQLEPMEPPLWQEISTATDFQTLRRQRQTQLRVTVESRSCSTRSAKPRRRFSTHPTSLKEQPTHTRSTLFIRERLFSRQVPPRRQISSEPRSQPWRCWAPILAPAL